MTDARRTSEIWRDALAGLLLLIAVRVGTREWCQWLAQTAADVNAKRAEER